MRVAESRISKANICPYKGSEIPRWQELGLDPNRIYRLFRDPVELQKGASTFDGKPLLIRHEGVHAKTPKNDLWVGTIGKCSFEHPYLVTRPLTVLTQEAIDLIESEERSELSCGYRYDAEMVPGVYGGESYDGRMVNIQGNHVAIVEEGRAGPDVRVADELPAELRTMKSPILEKVQRLLRANATEVDVRLAFDAALGETPARSVMSLDEHEKKAAEDKARDAKRARGSDEELSEEEREEAHDAARDEKEEAHDSNEEAEDEREEKADEGKEDDEAKDRKRARDARKGARDARKRARDKRAHDRKHARDSAGKHVAQNMDKRGAKDALPDPKDHRKDFRAGDSVTKDAMDAAIKAAIEQTKKRERAAAIAREAVRPVVGAVDLAMDSAESIYKFALEHQGVDLSGVPESAYPALFGAVRKTSSPAPRIAMDSAGTPVDRKTLLGLN